MAISSCNVIHTYLASGIFGICYRPSTARLAGLVDLTSDQSVREHRIVTCTSGPDCKTVADGALETLSSSDEPRLPYPALFPVWKSGHTVCTRR